MYVQIMMFHMERVIINGLRSNLYIGSHCNNLLQRYYEHAGVL